MVPIYTRHAGVPEEFTLFLDMTSGDIDWKFRFANTGAVIRPDFYCWQGLFICRDGIYDTRGNRRVRGQPELIGTKIIRGTIYHKDYRASIHNWFNTANIGRQVHSIFKLPILKQRYFCVRDPAGQWRIYSEDLSASVAVGYRPIYYTGLFVVVAEPRPGEILYRPYYTGQSDRIVRCPAFRSMPTSSHDDYIQFSGSEPAYCISRATCLMCGCPVSEPMAERYMAIGGHICRTCIGSKI